MKYHVMLAGALTGTLPTCGLAAEQLPTVVITASRVAEPVQDSLSTVSVISRKEIEQTQAEDLLTLLRLQPGLDLGRTGGPGQSTSLFMRGANSDHVLVLIDGVRAYSANSGGYAWERLPLSQIERIEIARGPHSTLYGSEAMAGVIQIFTRRSEGISAEASYGSYDTRRLAAGIGGQGMLDWSLQVSAEHSDGFSATNPNAADWGGTHDPDRDGYNTRSAGLRLGADLPANQRLSLSASHTRMDNEYDVGDNESLQQVLSLGLSGELGTNWRHELRLGQHRDEIETISSFPSDIRSRRRSAEWLHHLQFGEQRLLSLGADYFHDEGDNTSSGAEVYDESTHNRAAFLQWQQTSGRLDWLLGLRHDDHSRAGDHTTGRVGLGFQLRDDLRFTLNAGTAFKAPDLNELYHPGYGGFYAGNPDLEPEQSQSLELGMQYTPAAGHELSLHLFQTDYDDLIAYQGTNFQAINIDEAKVQGMEFGYSGHHQAWHWQTQLTLQRAKDQTTGKRLLRRPDAKLASNLQYRLANGGHLGAQWLLSDRRWDTGNIRLASYGVVDLYAGYPLDRHWEIGARVDNLFDTEYELARGYNTADRSAYVSVSYRQ